MKPHFAPAQWSVTPALVFAALLACAAPVAGQQAMEGMPGMAATPTPTPTPKKAGAPSAKTRTDDPSSGMKDMPRMATPAEPLKVDPKPAPRAPMGNSTPQGQKEMDAMPGMDSPAKPANAAPEPKMADMPGMAPETPAKNKVDMDSMPGMAAPAKGSNAAPAPKMEDMPGMSPAKPAKKEDAMDAMPGMAPGKTAGKKDQMSNMPGMPAGKSAKRDEMSGMPGMAANASAKQRMSEPGVTILGPPRKWVPPTGDNRAAELLSEPMLDAQLKQGPPPIEDKKIHTFLLFDLLEYRAYNRGSSTLTWDVVGWVGGDYNRLWVKSEGDLNLQRGNGVQGDLQLLYGRLIAPFWDLQAGFRFNAIAGPGRATNSRGYFVFGFQGLAPGRFALEPSIYISNRGEVSAELTASADLYLTQHLVMQPRLEVQASVQGDRQFQTGSGLNQTDLGLRFRYEIRREFAPYLGVTWQRKYGNTAAISRADGEPSSGVALVIGLQTWF